MSLTTDLVMYHDLGDSAPADCPDEHSTYDLTNSNVTGHASAGPGGKKCAIFNSGTDYYDLSSQSPFNYYTGFSVSFWAYFVSFSSTGNWLASHRDSAATLYFQVNAQGNNSDKIRFTMFDDGDSQRRVVDQLSAPSTDTWYHVVATNNATQSQLWIDGSSQGTDTVTQGTKDTGSTTYRIGQAAWSTSTALRHNGRMAMHGLWNRVLTSDEITTLYNSGSGLLYSEFPAAFQSAWAHNANSIIQ